jgi:hypothetical protein
MKSCAHHLYEFFVTNLSVTLSISKINVSGNSFRITGACTGDALTPAPANDRLITPAPGAPPPNALNEAYSGTITKSDR